MMFGAEAKLKRADKLDRAVERGAASRFASQVQRISGLQVTDTDITYRGAGGPLSGAHFAVGATGDLHRHVSATRWMVAGPLGLAWHEQRDDLALFLVVDGDGYAFVVPLDAGWELDAWQIAARLSVLAAR